ncbi:ABC transporter substrate-binding protein [Rhodovulum sulfidophilum]|uniref:ABC transporter substrate-binding protein n=1 Tax=Rhodovulum sulfidophilum TaxID=35806 RepID=UPI001F161B2F|nr:ABC transporter substrate-binding protein [Rhodovulum sulfidophilum]MCE8438383.1 ABC transporter substrate-binding protein [Rhodovulum sulfidophilum]
MIPNLASSSASAGRLPDKIVVASTRPCRPQNVIPHPLHYKELAAGWRVAKNTALLFLSSIWSLCWRGRLTPGWSCKKHRSARSQPAPGEVLTLHLRQEIVMRVLAVLAALAAATPSLAIEADTQPTPGILIGDRLLNVATHLRIVPQAYSIRQTDSALDTLLESAGSLPLGTPAHLVDENPCAILVGLLETEAPRIVVESSDPFDVTDPAQDPQRLMPLITQADLVEHMGTAIETVDFTIGADLAIFQIGEMFGRSAEAAALLDEREARIASVEALLPLDRPMRATVLHGADGGDMAVTVERPGGPTDLALLDRIGVETVGAPTAVPDAGGAPMRVDWHAIAAAEPDVIVATGDADQVRAALRHATASVPALSGIPAVAADAILPLPAYSDMDVVGYPYTLEAWTRAFSEIAMAAVSAPAASR